MIFKGVAVAKNHLTPESEPLKSHFVNSKNPVVQVCWFFKNRIPIGR